jgi:hypothetical protein
MVLLTSLILTNENFGGDIVVKPFLEWLVEKYGREEGSRRYDEWERVSKEWRRTGRIG